MEAEYVNDILYDEYCSEVDNYSNECYDDDFDPYIHNFKSGTWQESMERHGYAKYDSGALWEMFKTRLHKPDWSGAFLFRKTNGLNNMCKLIHETDKAILIQEYDDESDKLIPNKSFWVPRSLLYFKQSEPKSLIIYVPWFFNIKYI